MVWVLSVGWWGSHDDARRRRHGRVNPVCGARLSQVIRRLRDLGVPLDKIRGVLSAPHLRIRNERIASYLGRLEQDLGRVQSAVFSLRDLLSPPSGSEVPADIELRSLPGVRAAVIISVGDAEESAAWLQGALGEIRATLMAQQVPAGHPAGGIFADEVFTHHRGTVTIYVPCLEPVRPMGRVKPWLVPSAELADRDRLAGLPDQGRVGDPPINCAPGGGLTGIRAIRADLLRMREPSRGRR